MLPPFWKSGFARSEAFSLYSTCRENTCGGFGRTPQGVSNELEQLRKLKLLRVALLQDHCDLQSHSHGPHFVTIGDEHPSLSDSKILFQNFFDGIFSRKGLSTLSIMTVVTAYSKVF
jgi:hypothetical protein